MVSNVPQMARGKSNAAFSGWEIAGGKVEVLLVVSRFVVDRGPEV